MFPEVFLFDVFLALSLFSYFVLLCLFLFYLISSISILDTYLYTNERGRAWIQMDGEVGSIWEELGVGKRYSEYMEKFYFQLKKNNAPWTEPVGIRNLLTRVRTRVQFLGLEWRKQETACPLTSMPFHNQEFIVHCFTVNPASCIWSKVKLLKW